MNTRTPSEVQRVRQLNELLLGSPSYQALDAGTQRELAQAVGKINGFLAADPASGLARPFAPDLSSLRAGGPGASAPPASGWPAPPSPAPAPAGAAPAPAGGSPGAVSRAGEVARATLSAIDFPSFVASLIQGTFQAIVNASIQQMEAYAEMLKSVAGTVDRFMQDNISDGMARDHLAEQYGQLFTRDTSGGTPRLSMQPRSRSGAGNAELPSFFKDMGFSTPDDIDEDAIEQVVVPQTRRHLAEARQRTLATMVLMGINRVVVDDGEISAKLQFHIDASESMAMRFDQTKTTAGNMSGTAGRSPFGAQAVMVNTASINAQSDINVRADLTGQVKVKFRSETFPLERFADSAAIQLINGNARVPQAAGAVPAAPAPAVGAAPAPVAAPPAALPAPPPQPVVSQAWGGEDPWAPGA
ncbi:hypothetical protein LRS03_05315 [Rhizobacter sp. J219]|uniref:hypothetical protein n=1 Tax=Rhizobacter sp. J219 TaxID=2898430 RepID=UPI0021519C67|nr:hypothetical protein [Rhizobacter sp. J219]MCR5882309.1 hypothetical protein [Rhizobacter sp. J219]